MTHSRNFRRAFWQSLAGIAIVFAVSHWFSAAPLGTVTALAFEQQCAAGTWNNGIFSTCQACSTTCPAGMGQTASCTPTSDRVCSVCAPGTYNRGDSLSCVPCSASCPAGTGQTASCTATADRVCGACAPGFTNNGSSLFCSDINECATNNGGCSVNAACSNTAGSRACGCRVGFAGDGLTCNDINECATNNGGCSASQACVNTPGSRSCVNTTNALVPSVYCVMPKPGDPGMAVALFAYNSKLTGLNGQPYEYPYDVMTNALFVNGDTMGAMSGAPQLFAPGMHVNVFSVAFGPTDDVVWRVVDPQTGTVHEARPGPSTPLCVALPSDGEPGPQGVAGDPGPAGVQGEAGPTGPRGPTGDRGLTGSDGPKGDTGERGPQGVTGPIGPAGLQGVPGAPGLTGPAGPQGVAGPTGATGEQGAAGAAGAAGPQGVAGPQGPAGVPGAAGNTGPMGPVGPAGPTGIGLSFVTLTVDEDSTLVLPPGSPSVMYLARMEEATRRRGGRSDAQRLDLVLPAAANSRNRFITVRRVDAGGQVIVRTNGEPLEGAAEIRVPRDSNAVRLENRYDYITFVTDGTKWYVFAQGK